MQTKKLIKWSFLTLIAMTGVAFASTGYFISAKATVGDHGNNILVTFKEAGLGNIESVSIRADANSVAVYECINKNAGRNVTSENRHSVKLPVSASGVFNADKDRFASGSLVLSAPQPNFSCPTGQSPLFQSATYTDVKVTDTYTKVSQIASNTY